MITPSKSIAFRRPVRRRIYVLFAAFSVGVALLVIVAAEVLLSIFAPARWRQLSERKHAEFDPLLGWVNQSKVDIPDAYGAGVGLTTNLRRFRGKDELDDGIPAGKTRIVCSGDSFTLGYGVGDAETYPRQLQALDTRLEVVNMGQGGYGVDQAYLWYERDATFEHDVQVFGFITADLRRMRSSQFFGYAKPLLKVEDGVLRPSNTPLSNVEQGTSSNLVAFVQRTFNKSQIAWAGRALFGKTQESVDGVLSEDEWQCFEAIVLELDKLNQERHSALCVAYLPASVNDYTGIESDRPRERVRKFCEKRRICFLDVVESWKQLPSADYAAKMISEATQHYSAAGNRFVARAIYRGLTANGLLPRSAKSSEAPVVQAMAVAPPSSN
jgi:hypothetical protein